MRGRAGSPEESTLLWEAPAVRKGKGHSAGSNWNDGICCRLQIHSPSHLKTPSFSPPRSVCSVMDWTVTYCGSCEVDGIHLDDETARLSPPLASPPSFPIIQPSLDVRPTLGGQPLQASCRLDIFRPSRVKWGTICLLCLSVDPCSAHVVQRAGVCTCSPYVPPSPSYLTKYEG